MNKGKESSNSERVTRKKKKTKRNNKEVHSENKNSDSASEPEKKARTWKDLQFLQKVDISEGDVKHCIPEKRFIKSDARGKVSKKYLPVGWSDKLARIVYDSTSITCCLCFKRADVNKNDEFIAYAYCSECDLLMKISSSTENGKKVLTLFASPSDESKHTYKKRRDIKGEFKETLKGDLKKSYPFNVRNKLAENINIDDLKQHARLLPSLNALNVLKSKENSELKEYENDLIGIRRMMYSHEFKGCIKQLSTDPLQIIYWSQYQKMWFKNYKSREKTIILSIDATSSVIKKIQFQLQEKEDSTPYLEYCKPIYLYCITAKTKLGPSVPVGQMVSSDQHSR